MPRPRYNINSSYSSGALQAAVFFISGRMNRILSLLLPFCLLAQLSFASAPAQTGKWAVVKTPSCILRLSPDYESSCESQCLMGTVVQVKDSLRYWRQVDAPDYKNCWTNDLVLVYMSEEQKDEYIKSPKWICTATHSAVYSSADEHSPRLTPLEQGCILRRPESCRSLGKGGFVAVILPDGTAGWVKQSDVEEFEDWAARCEASASGIIETAKSFLGSPYFWGGCTAERFDCSGLVKFCYMLNGLVLPRNAREQIHCGRELPFNLEEMQSGDLVFFGSLDGKGKVKSVTHVALYIGDGRIIHSSQLVRINSLVKGSEDYYERQVVGVRRILGCAQEGETAVPRASEHPWYY